MSKEKEGLHKKLNPTDIFFSRPVETVAQELSQQSYAHIQGKNNLSEGNPKSIRIGENCYQITLSETFRESEIGGKWTNRIPELRQLEAGTLIAYNHMIGTLTFIKVNQKGVADIMMIREIQDIRTGQKSKNPTEVTTKILALEHETQGYLTYIPGKDEFEFKKRTINPLQF